MQKQIMVILCVIRLVCPGRFLYDTVLLGVLSGHFSSKNFPIIFGETESLCIFVGLQRHTEHGRREGECRKRNAKAQRGDR